MNNWRCRFRYSIRNWIWASNRSWSSSRYSSNCQIKIIKSRMGCKVFWTRLSRSMNCIRIYPRKGLFWPSMKLFSMKSKIRESTVLIMSFHHAVFKPAFINHFKFQFRILTLPIPWHRIMSCNNFFQTWWETRIKEVLSQTLEWT